MTLRDAIQLKKDFQFEKRTLTTSESGDNKVYHYFAMDVNSVVLILAPDDNRDNVWYGSILNYSVKFYTWDGFKSLIKSIQNGEWNES
jgi:hypothetical protein